MNSQCCVKTVNNKINTIDKNTMQSSIVRTMGREECLVRYWCEDNGIDPFYWMSYRDNCPYLKTGSDCDSDSSEEEEQ